MWLAQGNYAEVPFINDVSLSIPYSHLYLEELKGRIEESDPKIYSDLHNVRNVQFEGFLNQNLKSMRVAPGLYTDLEFQVGSQNYGGIAFMTPWYSLAPLQYSYVFFCYGELFQNIEVGLEAIDTINWVYEDQYSVEKVRARYPVLQVRKSYGAQSFVDLSFGCLQLQRRDNSLSGIYSTQLLWGVGNGLCSAYKQCRFIGYTPITSYYTTAVVRQMFQYIISMELMYIPRDCRYAWRAVLGSKFNSLFQPYTDRSRYVYVRYSTVYLDDLPFRGRILAALNACWEMPIDSSWTGKLDKNFPDYGINWNDLARRAYDTVEFFNGNGVMLLRDTVKIASTVKDDLSLLKALPKKAKLISKLFLSVHYGYKLMALDYKDLYESLKAFSKANPDQRCQAANFGVHVPFHGMWYGQSRLQCYYGLYGQLEDPISILIDLLDLDITDTTIWWDLIPYSFVVDWFINIGDQLEIIDHYTDICNKHDVHATGQSLQLTCAHLKTSVGYVRAKYYRREYQAKPIAPSFCPEFNPNLSPQHWVEGAALYVSRH